MNGISQILNLLRKETKSTGTDYVGTVTRVEGNTAYVRLAGADIDDTPVKMSISAQKGDTVRVRVNKGKAWITGNDTLPPTNDTAEVATKMSQDMSDRDKHIIIKDGVIKFVGDTLVVESKNFQLDDAGNATFSGNLNAAGGTFTGSVMFNWDVNNPNLAQTIHLGDSATSPFVIEYTDHSLSGDASTSISADTITIAEQGGMIWAEMTSSGIQTSSDRRLKDDIQNIDADMVDKLHPVAFRYKADPSKQHYGFIAQEIQTVMPDAVTENGEYLGVFYDELIAPAIAKIQQQEKRIKALEEALKENK